MINLSLKLAIVALTIVSTLLVYITPTQTYAAIIDHIENGQREIYDTENPQSQGCESTTLICYFPPNGSGLAAGPPPVVSQPQPQPQQNRINWLGLCLNPLVDYVITEDCYTLTTPDGYTLTSEGQRVLRCLAGGALVGILAPEILIQIRQLGPAVNCGGLGGSNTISGANVSGPSIGVSQAVVVMPLGSSTAASGAGYEPGQITVSPGATVVWDNQDNALHTATSGNPGTATPDGIFDTGLVAANQQSKPVTMPNEPRDYMYFCTLHPFLVGTVTVQ